MLLKFFIDPPKNILIYAIAGQKFALLEIKSTISKILQHFELLPEGPKPIPLIEIVLRSQNGIHLGLKQRMY